MDNFRNEPALGVFLKKYHSFDEREPNDNTCSVYDHSFFYYLRIVTFEYVCFQFQFLMFNLITMIYNFRLLRVFNGNLKMAGFNNMTMIDGIFES